MRFFRKFRINKRKIITLSTIIVVFVMSLGYAALNQHMDIDGVAVVDRNWNVKITNLQKMGGNGTSNASSYVSTTATMDATLLAGIPTSQGNVVVYYVTIQNTGNIPAKYVGYEAIEDDNTSITYTVFPNAGIQLSEGEILPPDGTTSFGVTIRYQDDATNPINLNKKLMITFNFVQDESSSVTSPGGGSITQVGSNHREYKLGDKVTLKDGSKWYVVNETGTNEELVTLWSETQETGVQYSLASDNNSDYSVSEVRRYLENAVLPTIKTSLDNSSGDSTGTTIRLLSAEEITRFINKKVEGALNLYTTEPSHDTWLMQGYRYTYGNSYQTDGDLSDTVNVRPVITTLKSNISKIDFGYRVAFADNTPSEIDSINLSKPSRYSGGYVIKPPATKTTSTTVTFTSGTSYYFATSFEPVSSTAGTFKLAGEKVKTTWSSSTLSNYPYTCVSTTDGTCTNLYKMTAYSSATSGTGGKHSYTTTTVTFTAASTYFYAKNYKFDPSTGYYTLDNTTGNYTSGTWKSMSTNYATYPYTCKKTSLTGTCATLYKMITYTSITKGTSHTFTRTAGKIENGHGLFVDNTYTENSLPTYFFRGDVTNNNVMFAGLYWKIVRVNEDGTVRLIFQGDSATDPSPFTTTMEYDETHAMFPQHVGFMRGSNVEALSYNAAHGNSISSSISLYLRNWGQANIVDKGYDSIVSNEAGFCNDRSIFASSSNGYSANTTHTFSASERARPQFACPNPTNDLFTASSSSKGNKVITQMPVGLITSDEVRMAGITPTSGTSMTNHFLYASLPYWTMTPYSYTPSTTSGIAYGNAYVYYVLPGSLIGGSVAVNGSSFGVRPVVNISADINKIEGIGTASVPYIIS